MKSMKGKILKKLKSIKPIGSLKQDRVLQVNASDGFVGKFPKTSNPDVQTRLRREETEAMRIDLNGVAVLQEPDMVDVTELMRDLEDQIMEFDKYINEDDKENIGPPPMPPQLKKKSSVFAKEDLVSEAPRFLQSIPEFATRSNPPELARENLVSESPRCLDSVPQFVTKSNPPETSREILVSEAPRFLESIPEMVSGSNSPEIAMEILVSGSNSPEIARKILVSEAPRSLESRREEGFTQVPLSEIDVTTFRRPELSSGSLFDPNLLEAFQQAVMEHARIEKEFNCRNSEEPPLKVQRVAEEIISSNPLFAFEEKCPPGGSESVILYTTSLRGIRKTFEDCHSIRFLLESFRILFCERDVSMHSEFREELWRILDGKGKDKVVPPRLFIKGRYIGGAEEVLVLHEQGKFRPLFDGIPSDRSNGRPCDGCAGFRFVVCFNCSGSQKVIGDDDDDGSSTKTRTNCPDCNENGLIICPICC